MKNINAYLVAIALVGGLFMGYTITKDLMSNNSLGASSGFGDGVRLVSPTHTGVTLGPTTSTLILAVDTGYIYGQVCNATSTAGSFAYLAVGADAASSTGITVAPNTCWPADGTRVLLGGRLEGTATNAGTPVTLIYE